MKKNEKHISYLTTEQGAILGALIGFFATIGFCATFTPMVGIIHLVFKNYYSYAIPDIMHSAFWLFFVIVFMVGVIFALINSVGAMVLIWIQNHMQKEPENLDARLDIKIED